MSINGRLIRVHNLQSIDATYASQVVGASGYYTIQDGERVAFADDVQLNQDIWDVPPKAAIDDGGGVDFTPSAGRDWLNLIEPDFIKTQPEGVSGGFGYFVRNFIDSVSSAEMIVNGSATPIDFEMKSDSDCDLLITEIRVFGAANAVRFGGFLNRSSPLTNGIACEFLADGQPLLEIPNGTIKTTDELKNSFSFGVSEAWDLVIQNGRNVFKSSIYFSTPITLRKNSNDVLRLTIQDNLTQGNTAITMGAAAFGFKRKS